MKYCYNCKKILQAVIPNSDDDTIQLDDALHLSFHGGYGMYIESRDMLNVPGNLKPEEWDYDATMSIFLCEKCVNEARQQVPWLDNLFEEIKY